MNKIYKISTIDVMNINKTFIPQLLQWICALFLAVSAANLLTFVFYAPCQDLPRTGGSTTAYLIPDSHGVYGMEGYCIASIDKNGYVNRDVPLDTDYYLLAGSSHMEGLFLPARLRTSDILSDMLGGADRLKVYNIARSGNFFSIVLQHLDGILDEFPDSKGIIIETDTLTYDTKALYDSMLQTGIVPDESAYTLLNGLSGTERLKLTIKKFFPLIRELHKQYLTYREATAEEASYSDILDAEFWEKEYAGGYSDALDTLMSFVRSKTDKKIIILYHPAVSIEHDGSLKLLTNGAEPYYEDICKKHDIYFVDMSKPFLNAYEEDHIVPYGFYNTTMGARHANRSAQKMMAEELYRILGPEADNDL